MTERLMVIDSERSESGRQPKRSIGGRRLHCCCVCGQIEVWGHSWSAYCSIKDMDDGEAIPKFCSEECRSKAGPKAKNVTDEMKQRANDAQWREPKIVWREPTSAEKYNHAASEQRRLRRAETPPSAADQVSLTDRTMTDAAFQQCKPLVN